MDLMGSPNIGVYCLVTDRLALVPIYVTESKIKRIEELLEVDAIRICLGGSILNGALAVANSTGIILPGFADSSDEQRLKSKGFSNVVRLSSRETAFGNLVLTNDNGGIHDPELPRSVIKKLTEVLDVELVPSSIARLPYVGALAVANNKGIVTHPLVEEDEQAIIEDVLKVPVTMGTSNGGVPVVKSGVLANDKAALVGSSSTGPELVIISQALGFVG
jgi:translation initiation factor 6